MFQNKNPSSSNDDLERYWHATATPVNSPRRFTQRKDLSLIAAEHGSLNIDSKPSLQAQIQSYEKGDFQKEEMQYLQKISDKSSSTINHSPQYADLRNGIPNVTVTADFRSPVIAYLECKENCLDHNGHDLSENLNEMECDTDSSFNDRLSTMAICPSETSNYDSLSDFENSLSDEENCKILQSMSLDDRKSTSPLYLPSTFDEFKQQKAASFEDLQNIPFNYLKF